MPVVAMTREMGSGGREVPQGVADKMGLTVILHELVEHHLAEHMHVRDSAVHHRLEGGATLRERWQNPEQAPGALHGRGNPRPSAKGKRP